MDIYAKIGRMKQILPPRIERKVSIVLVLKSEKEPLPNFLDIFEQSLIKTKKSRSFCDIHQVKLGIAKCCWQCISEEDKLLKKKLKLKAKPETQPKDQRLSKDKKWSKEVKKRDIVCRLCGKSKEESRLQAHHIKSRSKYPELRHDLDNGITLCLKCHAKKHPNLSKLILSHKDMKYPWE